MFCFTLAILASVKNLKHRSRCLYLVKVIFLVYIGEQLPYTVYMYVCTWTE